VLHYGDSFGNALKSLLRAEKERGYDTPSFISLIKTFVTHSGYSNLEHVNSREGFYQFIKNNNEITDIIRKCRYKYIKHKATEEFTSLIKDNGDGTFTTIKTRYIRVWGVKAVIVFRRKIND
jgi:hypothetical protein